MSRCESWSIKKAECWRIDAFELWCWRRLLRVPWIARRSNQSILKEISPEYSLVGLMLMLKFQYLVTWCEELTHWKRPWCWERLRQEEKGMTEDEVVGWPWVWVNSGSWWWTGRPGVVQSMGSQRVRDDWATPWTVACQASLSMRFPRQEYWSGLPVPSPGDLPNTGIKLGSLALQAGSLPTELKTNTLKKSFCYLQS